MTNRSPYGRQHKIQSAQEARHNRTDDSLSAPPDVGIVTDGFSVCGEYGPWLCQRFSPARKAAAPTLTRLMI